MEQGMAGRLLGVGCRVTYGQWVDRKVIWPDGKPEGEKVGEACAGDELVVVTMGDERECVAEVAKVIRRELEEWVRGRVKGS
jgi:hypothetical protein